MKKDRIKLILICICVLAAGICYVTGIFGVGGGSRTVITAEKSSEMQESRDVQETKESQELQTQTADKIFVHVCGEVISPGVYEFPSGSRIYQAVTQAGGYTAAAADDFLNMAQVLEDGMKITIPDKETAKELSAQNGQAGAGTALPENAPGAVSKAASGDAAGEKGAPEKININTASKEQLMTLSGVGEAKAADIIAYREQSGPFSNIEDIMKVSGIKEAGFQKIRENITV